MVFVPASFVERKWTSKIDEERRRNQWNNKLGKRIERGWWGAPQRRRIREKDLVEVETPITAGRSIGEKETNITNEKATEEWYKAYATWRVDFCGLLGRKEFQLMKREETIQRSGSVWRSTLYLAMNYLRMGGRDGERKHCRIIGWDAKLIDGSNQFSYSGEKAVGD
ncbi:unnamed protein product [Citrullus colocynthis]|uniref:Uncharacterized protein n=1 Tax=Citrullus colocynthis TaxID=252529 RepID=A0ABP0YI49_9ROSI